MSKFLKKFTKHTEYNNYINSEDKLYPSISYCKDDLDIHYDSVDNSLDYFTTTALESGSISFYIISLAQLQSMSYSKNGGVTWTTTNINNNSVTITVNVNKNESVIWKGIGTQTGSSSNDGSYFSSTCKFNVSGNIMSLIAGDNYMYASTTLSSSGTFEYLFWEADKLVSAKNLSLPATTLTTECYYAMFAGCTSLIDAPKLPATNLAYLCYAYMFEGCTALTKAPELSATTLVESCYEGMFKSCTCLNTIKCFAKSLSATNCLIDWVNGVANEGTFISCDATDMTDTWSIGNNGIPTGWLNNPKYFCTEILTSGTITLTIPIGITSTELSYIEYSKDTKHWTKINVTSNINTISVDVIGGEKVYWRGNGTKLATSSTVYSNFSSTCKFNVSGYLVSLTKYNTFTSNNVFGANNYAEYLFYNCTKLNSAYDLIFPDEVAPFCCRSLFRGCTNLKKAPKTLPTCALNNNSANYFAYMFYNCTSLTEAPSLPSPRVGSSGYYEMFRGCTNLKTSPALPATTLGSSCYRGMFRESGLTVAPVLSAMALNTYCYCEMFKGCTTLTTPPDLPATTLVGYCYNGMFSGSGITSLPIVSATSLGAGEAQMRYMFEYCTGITQPLAVPFITLTNYCYECMYRGCTNLVSVPQLPATTLAEACYQSMFQGCTSITSAPALNATTMAAYCYRNMFYGCSNLTTAPDLPATTLGTECYKSMFNGTSITTTPALPATTLTTSCYHSMFMSCTSLTTVSTISATTLAAHCYEQMFRGCSALTTAPTLPVTTLAESCYKKMFVGCTALTSAPDLLATTLTTECYFEMFYSCGNINYIKCLATDISATDCTANWLYGVASSGTFVQVRSTRWSEGTSGTPTSWLRYDQNNVQIINYLRFTATEAGTFTVTIPSNITTANCTSISYSLDDGDTWTTLTNVQSTEVTMTTPSVAVGDEVVWKGTALSYGTSTSVGTNFTSTGKFTVSGDIISLFYNGDLITTRELPNKTYSVANLFRGCTTVTDASQMKMGTNTRTGCYAALFYGCTELLHGPVLPAMSLSGSCYYWMFYECTKLVECPTLPATNFGSASSVYYQMFYGCTALTAVCNLPATSISSTCYRGMFYSCTGLTTVPENLLPATTLYGTCYYEMFRGCKNLTNAPKLPATTLQNSCYSGMFRDCSALTTAPDLPAVTLVSSCYNYMFYKCTVLNYIKAMFTTTPSNSYTGSWVTQVASSGTFVKNSAATWTLSGNSGIPSGWTVQTASS